MSKITRREFLCGSAASVCALALGMVPGVALAEEESGSGEYEWELLTEVTADESRTSTANSDEKLDYVCIGLGTVPSSMDPYSFNKSSEISVEVFETLVVATDDGDFVGIIAKDWEYTDESETELVMNIYEGVTDSDGNEITAEDVVFSFETYIESGNARDFDDFDSCEASDTYQVTFHFKQKLSSLDGFDNIFASTYIVSQTAYESHNYNVDPIGTGPYKITNYEEGASCVLEAREDYWQSEENLYQSQKSNVKTIEYQFILDDSMRLIALESGTIAYCSIDDTSLTLFEEGGQYAGQFNIYCYEDAQSQTILPNMSSNSIMSDMNMRLAVYYALDSEAFADALGNRVYYPCTVDCAPVVGDYQSDWDTWETYNTVYDPDLSAEYLAASGYNGETLQIMTEDNSEKNTIAEVVQAYLEIAGISSEITTLDHALIENSAGDSTQWDILIYSSADSDYAISRFMKTYSVSHGYADGYNLSFYEDDAFQEMLDTVFNVDTYSEEGTNEIMQYIYDNALGYAGCYAIKVGVYDPVMAKFYRVSGTSNLVVGACDYYLDL